MGTDTPTGYVARIRARRWNMDMDTDTGHGNSQQVGAGKQGTQQIFLNKLFSHANLHCSHKIFMLVE